MTDIAIKVENLGKCYQLGGQKSGSFRESMTSLFSRNSRAGSNNPEDPKEFWALKDVSFEIKRGEAVGIIGRNGAGKSTLLKILSRITEPTKGRFEIFGRVSSLLEVGTGFHEELTGRENVFLNGTILGMRRAEVKAKFDEIVAFSGVEKFIDTPVKHYSSGMKVRLAFAVAAHLEPEILVIDEVLAVGDAEFQKKCLGKMEDVTGQGRTVLFVSHNVEAIERFCKTGLLLEKGSNKFYGNIKSVLDSYINNSGSEGINGLANERNGSGKIKIVEIYFESLNGDKLTVIRTGQSFKIVFKYVCSHNYLNRKDILIGFSLKTVNGTSILLHHNRLTNEIFNGFEEKGAFVCEIVDFPLSEGIYHLSYSIMESMGYGNYLDQMQDAISIDVTSSTFYQSGETPPSSFGFCCLKANWSNKLQFNYSFK